MSKYTYLANPDVAAFINWLAPKLESDELSHSWTNRRTNEVIHFTSLWDAFLNYNWPFSVTIDGKCHKGTTFKDSHNVLTVIANRLGAAIEGENRPETLKWSVEVLRWGGVYARNGAWLRDRFEGLPTLLTQTSDLLQESADENSAFEEIERFNAGMTKIYSLLVPRFIILDSRVLAALGWLIVKFCKSRGLELIPASLRFPWLPAKEGPNPANSKNRNPSEGNLKMPRMGAMPALYVRENLKASWILQGVLDTAAPGNFLKHESPLRAIEAALFMIGYSLDDHAPEFCSDGASGESPKKPGASAGSIDDNQSDDGKDDESEENLEGPENLSFGTKGGKQIPFKSWMEGENLMMCNINGLAHKFDLNEIIGVLKDLEKNVSNGEFHGGWIPLANNVELMNGGGEKNGFGMAILRQQPGEILHAQGASYLGPILEEINVLEWNGRRKGICWRLVDGVPGVNELAVRLACLLDQ
jgi:hypothetical protein